MLHHRSQHLGLAKYKNVYVGTLSSYPKGDILQRLRKKKEKAKEKKKRQHNIITNTILTIM